MEILKFDDFLNEMDQTPKIMQSAAGVAILYQNKILLVHPTGGSWKKGTCGIPKGGMEPDEDPMEAALRELREETGIVLSPSQLLPSPETVVTVGKNKVWNMIYYICKINDLAEVGLESEKVPKDQLQAEEIDWAKFVTAEEAYPITSRSQLIILDRHLSLK